MLRLLHLAYCAVIFLSLFASEFSFFRVKSRLPPSAFGKPTPYAPHIYYLFVYGKLKKGEENHYWLTNPENGLSKFIAIGQTVQKYPLTVGKYMTPILINSPGKGHKILGEIYVVDSFMLKNLDKLEGFPTFNERKMEVIRMYSDEFPKGKEMLSWIYYARIKFSNVENLNLISEYSSKNKAVS